MKQQYLPQPLTWCYVDGLIRIIPGCSYTWLLGTVRTDDVFLCSYGIGRPVITLETLGTGRHDGREKPIHSLSRVDV